MTKLGKTAKQSINKSVINSINLEPLTPYVKNALQEDMYFLSSHPSTFKTARQIYKVLESNKTERDIMSIVSILRLAAINICFQVNCGKITLAEFEPIFKFFNEIPYLLEESKVSQPGKNDTFFLKRIINNKSGWRKICSPKKAKQILFDEELCSQVPQRQFFDLLSPYKHAAEVISMLYQGELVKSGDVKKLFFKIDDIDTSVFQINDIAKCSNRVLNRVLNIVTNSYSVIAGDELWHNFIKVIKAHPIDLLSSLTINIRLLKDVVSKDQVTIGFNLAQDILNIFAQALPDELGKEIKFLQKDENGNINLSWLKEMDRVVEAFNSKYASHVPNSHVSIEHALTMICRLYCISKNPIEGLAVALKMRQINPINQFRENGGLAQVACDLKEEEREVYFTKLTNSLTLIPQDAREKLLRWLKMSFKHSSSYDQEFLQEYETLKFHLEEAISTIPGSDPLIRDIKTLFSIKQPYFYTENNDLNQVENLLRDLENNNDISHKIKQEAKIKILYPLSFKPGFSKFIDMLRFEDVHDPLVMMKIVIIHLNACKNTPDMLEQNLRQAFEWLKNVNKLFFEDKECVDAKQLSLINQFVIMEFMKLGVDYCYIQKELFYIPYKSFENLIVYLHQHKISFNVGLGEMLTICMPGSDITLEEALRTSHSLGMVKDDVFWDLINQYYKDIKGTTLIDPLTPTNRNKSTFLDY
ncbi:hypothetical protein phytr_8840 [Candidatus Phycorickettsia trachydisci]|uniref:Uncharacterized protein n=1 Tax=Candidatus Phycorickettsia trachydisci TaxID=2115978 RepID=A0A2P1P986_9RICK|nr:hypothetical protein [Candidatus Phycorickettsia trachydisci]AVP87815.1 hypothetical protein phytr_8840 [Candidatus Phycorickettsia trachydisci]